jgi:hypothetical protein
VTHQTHRQFFLISLMPRFDGGDDFMLVGQSSEHMFQFEVKILGVKSNVRVTFITKIPK